MTRCAQPESDAAAAPGAPVNIVLKQGGGWSIPSTLLSLALLSAMVFYFYVRIAFTLQTGAVGYSIFVLVVEVLAASSMLPHLLYLLPKKARPTPQHLQGPRCMPLAPTTCARTTIHGACSESA